MPRKWNGFAWVIMSVVCMLRGTGLVRHLVQLFIPIKIHSKAYQYESDPPLDANIHLHETDTIRNSPKIYSEAQTH